VTSWRILVSPPAAPSIIMQVPHYCSGDIAIGMGRNAMLPLNSVRFWVGILWTLSLWQDNDNVCALNDGFVPSSHWMLNLCPLFQQWRLRYMLKYRKKRKMDEPDRLFELVLVPIYCNRKLVMWKWFDEHSLNCWAQMYVWSAMQSVFSLHFYLFSSKTGYSRCRWYIYICIDLGLQVITTLGTKCKNNHKVFLSLLAPSWENNGYSPTEILRQHYCISPEPSEICDGLFAFHLLQKW
jgi:hypothetical protein